MQRALLHVLLLFVLVSCDSKQPQVRHEPIVVWTSYEDETYLPTLFEPFTASTGIPVTVKYDRSNAHATNLVFNIGSPPADLYMTRVIADLWETADEGALRPITAANLAGVPDALRDADKLWTALNYQQSVIIHQGNANDLPADVIELAKRQYQGRLCVSSSSLATNRQLLAMLIDLHGEKATERTVRNWMINLASPPFPNEEALFAAVATGECEFGILSGWEAGANLSSVADAPVSLIKPATAYVQVEGIGVARHSRYPDSAQKLVNWLLTEEINKRHAGALRTYPVVGATFSTEAGPAPAAAGWRDDEAGLLAERAGYR